MTEVTSVLAHNNIKPMKYSDNIYYIKQVRKKKRSSHEEIPRKGRKEPNRESKKK